MGIRKVPVECLRDAVSNGTLLGRVEARQDSQQITEEFAADEVVVNEAVVLLAGIRRVGSDTRTQLLETCWLTPSYRKRKSMVAQIKNTRKTMSPM